MELVSQNWQSSLNVWQWKFTQHCAMHACWWSPGAITASCTTETDIFFLMNFLAIHYGVKFQMKAK